MDDVVGRLATGDSPARLVTSQKLTPADLVAAVAHAALGDGQSLGPPLVQSKPRVPALLSSLNETAWALFFPVQRTPCGSAWPPDSCRSTISGTPATTPPSRPTTWAKVNFQLTGTASPIAASPMRAMPATGFAGSANMRHSKGSPSVARLLLDQHGESQLAQRLIPGGTWNPTVMIELCTRAPSGTPSEAIARRLQRLEMWLLLEATYAAVARLNLT